jgi:hypothetical protein
MYGRAGLIDSRLKKRLVILTTSDIDDSSPR